MNKIMVKSLCLVRVNDGDIIKASTDRNLNKIQVAFSFDFLVPKVCYLR
jgi:hypothetical protein